MLVMQLEIFEIQRALCYLFIDDDGIVSGGFRSILNYARINPGLVHFSWSCAQVLGSWVETFVNNSNTRVLLLLPCIEQEKKNNCKCN